MRGTARASEQERESCLQARERESLQQTYSRKKEVFCLFFEIYVLEKKIMPNIKAMSNDTKLHYMMMTI